ncbi:MAG: hypothetical protein ABJL67_22815 [Sulfitobacter sp.]
MMNKTSPNRGGEVDGQLLDESSGGDAVELIPHAIIGGDGVVSEFVPMTR